MHRKAGSSLHAFRTQTPISVPPFAPGSGASCFKPQVFVSAFLQLGCSQKSVAGELQGLVPPARAPEVWGARGAQGAGQGPPTTAGVGVYGARSSPPPG